MTVQVRSASSFRLALIVSLAHGIPALAGDPPAQLLIARPGMVDPGFAESVVLVTVPPDSGPMGVILNKATASTIGDAFPDNPDLRRRTDVLCWGGPVEPNGLLAVFRMSPGPKRAIQVIDDIYLSGDGQILQTLVRKPVQTFGQRFFVGYAGWQEGQLEWELSQGAWYTLPADENVIFKMDIATMWRDLFKAASAPRIQAHYLSR